MSARQTSSSSRSLEGLHGVKLVNQLSCSMEKTLQPGGFNSTAEASGTGSGRNLNLPIQQIWQQRPPCLRPICCNLNGDRHVMETVANVLTSLPFIFLGLQAPRKNVSSTLYANSLIGVGVVSSLYHSSRGEVRKYFRWADYTTIAATTVCLSKALWNENPKVLMAASALLLPFQPLMVSAVHTGMMEVAFVRRASTNPDLKMAHSMHTMSSVLGGLLFVADDLFPQTPYLHAAWHLAAAVGSGDQNFRGVSARESSSLRWVPSLFVLMTHFFVVKLKV